jgi:hypothetical protein
LAGRGDRFGDIIAVEKTVTFGSHCERDAAG